MVTGFELLGIDRLLRKHWLHRILAAIVDGLMVFGIFGALFTLMDVQDVYLVGLVSALSFFVYSAALEAALGQTVGKMAAGLGVVCLAGDSAAGRAILRNVPKIFWFIHLPLDTVLGLAMRGDPRQRFMDRLAGTTVMHRGEPDHRDNRPGEVTPETRKGA